MARRIRLLGQPAIRDGEDREQPVRGHKAWALLARILLSRRPIDRRSLATELFPEADDPLGSLRWCLASLRKALDCAQCLSGDPIEGCLPEDVVVDVWRLDHDAFDAEEAGPLLDGIDPECGPEFSTWLLVERERASALVAARIRQDTIKAMSLQDHDRAIRLSRHGVRLDPFNEGAHVLLVKSLALAGRYETALAHVEATEKLFVAELGELPTVALRSAARRTVSSPPGGVSPTAFVNSLLQSGTAALSAGAVGAGLDSLRRAVHEAEKARDQRLHGQAMLELGTALVHSVRGYDDEGSVFLHQATDIAQRCGYAAIVAAGYRELGYVEALAGRRPSAAEYLAQAQGFAADDDGLAGIHAVRGFNLVDWGRVDDGLEQFAIALEHARRARNRRWEIWSLGLGARGLLAADRLREADAWLGDCLTLVDEQRWMAFRPWPVAVLGESRVRQGGDTVGLRPQLEEAFSLSCQLGDPCWEAAVARTVAMTYAAAEDPARAMDWLTEARTRCVRQSDSYAALHVDILGDQAEICLKLGRSTQADALAREWVTHAARTHMSTQVERAAAFLRRHGK
ncbi:MAG: hypothetical protein JNK67_15975 [Alphaproteobacteria bacterium]|nr:hypothetical protein [Alphaproteobacteria bacterium]